MKKILLILAITLSVLPLQAKKKLKVPFHQTVTLRSEPAGATVYMNGKQILAQTPGTANIQFLGQIVHDKKNMDAAFEEAKRVSSITLTFVKDGYAPQNVVIEPNITFQKLLGVKPFYYFEWPNIAYVNFDSARDEANNAVNRDRPGKTALERTIIRWYFESQPQGARIFWRVISSVPDQVKNTNENWLGNTPFEETRSFNIQGLTYENSRDVQIEIKVRRPGYIDQTKRFNVRQAIDQQEISSFFDMIKSED